MAESVVPIHELMQALIELLSRYKINYSYESSCQEAIKEILLEKHICFDKEFRLSLGVCDFFFPRSGIVLEVKAGKDWSRREVFRQLERYAKDDRAKGLILVTGKAQLLPSTINNIPTAVYQLGIGCL